MKPRRAILTPTDGLLLVITVVWAANYSIVKAAFGEISHLAFNSLRLVLASLLFLGSIAATRGRGGAGRPAPGTWCADAWSLTGREWLAVAGLGLVGHFVYQICWMGSVAHTSISNSSLILGCSPVAVALLTAALGHERVGRWHWAGAVLSVGGIYLLVGRGATVTGRTALGDLLAVCAVVCWTIYTVAARPLLERHSAMVITGLSMAIGTVFYVPLGMRDLGATDWTRVTWVAWGAIVFSAVFSLYVSYLIWYTAVQKIGNLRTSMYSNILPVLAMLIAWATLGEPITGSKLLGATAILGGVALTRAERMLAPPEE